MQKEKKTENRNHRNVLNKKKFSKKKDRGERICCANKKIKTISKNVEILGYIKVTCSKEGIATRKSPKYPGFKTQYVVTPGEVLPFIGKKKFSYNQEIKGKRHDIDITFYKLEDGRGWIHNYDFKDPLALNNIKVMKIQGCVRVQFKQAGIGIRKKPEYPGECIEPYGNLINVVVKPHETVHFTSRKVYEYNDIAITFYELVDGRGWIHNYNRDDPTACNGVFDISEAKWVENVEKQLNLLLEKQPYNGYEHYKLLKNLIIETRKENNLPSWSGKSICHFLEPFTAAEWVDLKFVPKMHLAELGFELIDNRISKIYKTFKNTVCPAHHFGLCVGWRVMAINSQDHITSEKLILETIRSCLSSKTEFPMVTISFLVPHHAKGIKVGSKVIAQKKTAQYTGEVCDKFPGAILKLNNDGTVYVEFPNGEVNSHCHLHELKIMKPTRSLCPHSHPLTYYELPISSFGAHCEICNFVSPPGEEVYRCGKCDWICCQKCEKKIVKDPRSTSVWYINHQIWFRSPTYRLAVLFMMMFFRFFLYAENPISDSPVDYSVPVMGHIINLFRHFPSKIGGIVFQVFFIFIMILLGLAFGRFVIHRRIVQKRMRLTMFIDHHHLQQRGSWICMLGSVMLFLYITAISMSLGPWDNKITKFLDGITGRDYIRWSHTVVWLCSLWVFFSVLDSLFQNRFHQSQYGSWASDFKRIRHSCNGRCHTVTYFLLMVINIILIACSQISIFHYARLGFTNQAFRLWICTFIIILDIIIFVQDWEFPTFESYDDDMEPITYRIEANNLRCCYLGIEIDQKWTMYGPLLIIIGCDIQLMLEQWLYSPINFGQFACPDASLWVITNQTFISLMYVNGIFSGNQTSLTCLDHKESKELIGNHVEHSMFGLLMPTTLALASIILSFIFLRFANQSSLNLNDTMHGEEEKGGSEEKGGVNKNKKSVRYQSRTK